MRRFGKSGESWTEITAQPECRKGSEATRRDRRPITWKMIGYYGNPVQVDGDREALRTPQVLRGSVQTSARRRGYNGVSDSKHCSLACIRGSSVARRRRTAWGKWREPPKPPPKTNPQRCRGNAVNRLMQDPGAGGRRPGGSDWPVPQSGVACIPKYAVLSRGCYEREEAHTSAQDTVRLKVTVKEARGFAPRRNCRPACCRKSPGATRIRPIVLAASAAARTGVGDLVLEWRRPGGTDSAEMSQG